MKTWLDLMDDIMDAPEDKVFSVSEVLPVLEGLSLEIKKVDTYAHRYKSDSDQWFSQYRHQCGQTEKWIKKYDRIESMSFLQRLHFLLTNDLSILDR